MGSGTHRVVASMLVALVLLSGCSARATKTNLDGTGATSEEGPLQAAFDVEPSVAQVGSPVRFLDRSTGPITAHAWDFGDGTASTDPAPVHTYRTAGVYSVTLRVRSADGDQDSDAKPLAVRALGTSPTPGGGGPGVATPDEMVFGTPTVARSSGGGEPSLAVDSKGNFFLSPPGVLLKSSDQGRTWSGVNYHGTISGDSHVVVDPDDRVWITDLQGFGIGLGAVGVPLTGPDVVWSSTDAGATWTSGNPAASTYPSTDRPWLAAPGGGVAYLLYRACTIPTPIGCAAPLSLLAKTTTGGLTWSPPTVQSFEWTSYPFVAKDGTLYVAESSGGRVSVAVSTNGGSTFTEHSVASRRTDTGNLFVNGAADDAGNAYVVWADTDRGQTDVYMSYSTDKATNWKGPFLVSPSLGTHVMPWIAAGGDGKVVVAWYGTDVKGNPNTLDAKANWFLEVAQSLNAHDATPIFVEVRASSAPMHVGAICTGGFSCTGDRDLLDFFMVQVTSDGRAAVAYASDGATSSSKALFVLQTGGPRAR